MSLERSDILAAIRDSDNNISKAAKKLGVARRTLQDRMRFYGLARGKAGRRKKPMRYSRATKRYAAAAVAVGAIAGVVLLAGRKPPTPTSA